MTGFWQRAAQVDNTLSHNTVRNILKKARHRAISGTCAEDDLERVHPKTLGADRGLRLLRDLYVEQIRFGPVRDSRLYETVDSTRAHCGDRTRNGWTVDGADCWPSDG